MKISAVYKITNAITGDFYIGSSKNVKKRWSDHKCKSTWNEHPNNPLYLDMQKYGLNKFAFEILEEVEPEELKEKEQEFIETLKPIYNRNRADGWDVERYKEYLKEYQKTEKRKKYQEEYNNQLCLYNGEILTLNALSLRFRKRDITYPTTEAKKYLIKDYSISCSLR